MRHSLTLSLLLAAAVCSATCINSSTKQSLLRLAPLDSVVVVAADWKAVSRDGELKRIIRGEQVEGAFRQLGIAVGEVSELAAFGAGREGPESSTGMLLRGTFDARAVASRLKAGGWTERGGEGRRVYTNPADGTRLAVVRKSLLVVGTKAGVEGVLKADDDSAESFASNSTYRKLAAHLKTGRHPVSMVVAFPETTQDMAAAAIELSSAVIDFAGAGPLGDLLKKIGYVRGFGCSINRVGDGLPVEILALMKDEESASFVSGSLNLLQGLSAMAPDRNLLPSDKAALGRIRKMSVTRKKDVLSIHLTMPLGGFE